MTTRTVAFLGATGDCAGFCLAAALKDGAYNCRALVRTSEKLYTSLKAKGVPEQISQSRLTVIQGNAKDVEAVKRLLTTDGEVVDTIVFGIGAAPKLQASLFPITLDDPQVCHSAMETLLAALADLNPAKKPLVVAVSTTGISNGPRDVPLLCAPVYHWLLAVPHKDKREMEQLLWEQGDKNVDDRVVSGFVVVRASLLVDGDGVGLEKIREGREGMPAVGYTIARKDVGTWIFERLVKRQGLQDAVDQAVTLTS